MKGYKLRTVQLLQKLLKTWLILVVLGGLYANIAHAAVVDIVVNQSDSPDPIAAGGVLTYTIVVTNNGPDDATGVVLADTIPASTTFLSRATTKGSCVGSPTITCTIGALANGESATVTIKVIPTVAGTISNTATSTRNEPDSNTPNNADTDVTTIQVGTDLSVTKTDSADPVSQGDTFSYAITARNNGPYALIATDTMTVTDNIPSGLRVNSLPTGTGWSCSPSSGYPLTGPFTLTCTKVAALATNANASVITVPVTALSLGTITNQAAVDSNVSDDNTINDTVTQSTTVNQAADTAITKAVSQASPLGLNQSYSYTLSPSLVIGTTGTITVTDNLPAGMQLLSTPTGTGWTCSPSAGFPLAGPLTVSCTKPSTSNSGSSAISLSNITINFQPTAVGTLNNVATISSGVTDPVSANNTSSTISSTITNDAQVTKVVSQTPNIGLSQSYTYTLQPVLNIGTTAGTITVTDNFPAGANMTSAPTGTGWTCTPNSGFPLAGPQAISCTRAGTGNPGPAAISLNNISYTFSPTATGSLTNTATINSGATDTTPLNNTSSVTNTVINDLQVTKTVNAVPAGFLGTGKNYTYTLTPLLNMGTAGGTITLTDSFPAGATLTGISAAVGWTCTPSSGFPLVGPQAISCTRATANNASTTPLNLGNVSVNFTATTAGSLSNTATISSPATDTTPANNSSTVVSTVQTNANMAINKTSSTISAPIGTNFTYTITASNVGPSDVTAVQTTTVTDPIPTGVTVSAIAATGWACTAPPIVGPATLTCTRTTALAAGSSFPTITLTASGTTAGLKSNVATIATTATDTDATNNSSTRNVTITSGVVLDVGIAKSDTAATYGPEPVARGDTVDYRVRVSNNGPNNANTGMVLTVTDSIPANSTYISAVGATAAHAWVCPVGPTVGPANIVCTRTITNASGNTFNNGNNSDIRFTLRADSGATVNNTVAVTSTASDSNAANDTAAQSTTIRGSADMSITKTASVPSLYAGENLTYTITVTNSVGSDPTGLSNVSVTDDMTTNPGATFVSASGTGWTCNGLINLVCDYNASLLAGQSASFTVTVKPSVVGAARSNTATVVFRQSGATFPLDPDASNNSATVNVAVLNSLDLFVTKSDAPDPVRVGTNLTYVVTVGNLGPGAATTTTMVDTLPAQLVVHSIAPSGSGSCTTSPVSSTYTSSSTVVTTPAIFTTLTCTWPSLASASQQTVTVIGRPNAAAFAASPISNTASVSHANSATVPDVNMANNSVTQPTVVNQAQIDLLVNKVDTPDPVARFTNMTYTVTVQNQGPSVATNVVVTENLPHTYLSYISATPSQGTCGVPVSNVMTCNLNNIEVGSNATIVIVMSADSLGTDTNSVSVTATETDTNLVNNSVSENTTVQLGADLQFSKLATPDPVIAGNAVFYFLKVKNTGPANASNVTLIDTFPTGISYQSYVASQGTCSHVTGVVTCNLGPLPYNATAQVTLTAVAMVGGLQLNSATVTSTTPDPNPTDNTDTAPVTVIDGIVRGRVFADNGLGGGTANNGLQNGGELGIANVIVKLTDCGTTDYVFAQTDGLGNYQLIVPALLATGAVLCVVETNLSGYRNTGGSAGTTAGTYNITTDKTQFTYTDGVTYTGVDFADVAQSQLFTDGIQQSEPNTSVVYAHRFIAGSDGQVSFSTTSIATPNSLFWTNVLYRDVDCDGVLDAGEPVISGLYTVQAGDNICLLNKQFVPSNATQGALNVVTLSSSFIYDTLAPAVTEVLTRTDTTTVGLTSTLTLHKSVDKATAAPGETITYTITYSNNGTQPIGSIVVHDSVPAFTHSPVATCVMPLPANITVCTPVITTPSIQWNMTGTLAPSQQGQVRFSTTLDN